MPDLNEIDRRALEALGGRGRLKALLKGKGLRLVDFAAKHNLWVQQVSDCLRGVRTADEVRDALAKELDIPRALVDRMLDGDDPAAVA